MNYYFTCNKCDQVRHRKLTYYRDNNLCGWCGHLIEYGKAAKTEKDLIGITRLITRVRL